MNRYAWLERQLDRDDLSDADFNTYNKELNSLQDEMNGRKAIQAAIKAEQLKSQQEEAELQKVLSLTEEQVEKMYQDSCLKHQDVNGMSFKEWYEQSLKYYTIEEGSYSVLARARSNATVEVIPHQTLALAKLTILKRIQYKFYDHAVRGSDFAYDI